jgi:AcrR family transcriptional regulator
MSGTQAGDVTERAQLDRPRAPVIRRPRPADGLDLARVTFLAGERVEMATIASRLDVSQATVYRWFGSRERLIERVLDEIAREFLAAARAQARGDGDERVLDYARGLMTVTVTLEPVRAFVEREPQLSLRLLLGEKGVIRRTLREALAGVVAETRSAAAAQALEDELDVLVEVAVALEWATFAIGDEPQIDHAMHIMRLILASHAGDGAGG